jgi:uncharacterized protein
MKILESLLNQLPAEPVGIKNVIIGVHWTLVSSKYTGLASTMVNDGPHGVPGLRDVGQLHQKSAQELSQWVLSDNLLEASLGMAAINSLIEIDESRMVQINAAEVIAKESKDKNLVIVGHFPFVERMKTIAHNCWVIEKRPFGDDFPEEASKEFIPQADVIAITGTTLINHTIEGLLSLCRPESLVMVLGPSTPLTSVLFKYGVSFLSGSRVIDEDAAITTIQQGAAFPQIKGVRLFTMLKENY